MKEGDSACGIITFDRAGIDKLVCHADSIERVTMVRNTISSIIQFRSHHSCSVLLCKRPLDIPKGGAFVVYRRKKAERVFDSMSFCLQLFPRFPFYFRLFPL